MVELVKAPPKSQQLAEFLRGKILSGELSSGKRLMTSRELAAKFAVSKQVVQSAFSQLEKDGLITSHVGRGTYVADRKRSMKSVGLIIPGINDEHNILPLVVQSHLQRMRCQVNIYDLDTVLEHPHTLDDYLRAAPDFLIIDAYSKFSFDLISKVPKSTRLVFVNRYEFSERIPDASYILLDYRKMGYICVKQLVDAGCGRVALITFERHSKWVSELFASGCEEAAAELGVSISHFIDSGTVSDSYYRDLLASDDAPDGFVSTSAFRVLPVVKILSDSGFTGKRDIPVISGNDTPWSEAFDLTSVDRKADEISAAIDYVIKSGDNVDVKIKPGLIFRKSCPENRRDAL